MFTAFKRNESGVFYESNEFFCVCTRVYVCVSMPLGHEVNALFIYTQPALLARVT